MSIFNKPIDRQGTSCYKYDLRRTVFGTDEVVPLWVADMDFEVSETITHAIQERMKHPIYGYTIRANSLNNAVADWLENMHHWQIKKNWLLYSPGVVPSIAYCIQAFSSPGDKIIIQPPVYHPFHSSIEENGRRIAYNPLIIKEGRYAIDFDHLEKITDEWTKMILFCSPHNPGGTVWKREELEQLAEFCVRKNIIIVADEIHSDLIYPNETHVPISTLSEAVSNITITLNAPSKTFNIAGLGASFIVCKNESLRNALKNVIQRNHASMINIFGLTAMEAAYSTGLPWLSELKGYLLNNRDFISSYLAQNIPALEFMIPEATFLFWINFNSLGLTPDQSKKMLIEKAKLGLNDGRMFGKGGEGWHRLNFGCSREVLENAMNSLNKALHE